MTIRMIELDGSLEDMGYAFGQQLADEAHRLSEERYRLCENAAPGVSRREILALAGEHLRAQSALAVHAEFLGIAAGADIAPDELLIGNGLTDFRDVLKGRAPETQGCTSFLVRSGATTDGVTYLGQTWDMHSSAEPFVVALRRKPKDGPQSLTLTTSGCLSLIGMNETGLAIGNNNLVPTDARPGVIYLAMIHDYLSRWDTVQAQEAITRTPRASGHNYYMSDGQGNVQNIETTACQWAAHRVEAETYAHANHYETAQLTPLAMNPPGRNSLERKRRLSDLLAQAAGQIDVPRLIEILSYRKEGDDGSISRHGSGCTCAAAIMCPERREVWFCQGPPDTGLFRRFTFA